MDELMVLVPALALAIAWIALVAYWIYKDHGVIERIDGKPYVDMLAHPTEENNLKSFIKNHTEKK
jgi:hypothetical protein